MLFAQSISFVLPQLLWQLFRHRARVDLHAVVHSAANAAASLDSETRNKHVVMAARMMERALARGHFGTLLHKHATLFLHSPLQYRSLDLHSRSFMGTFRASQYSIVYCIASLIGDTQLSQEMEHIKCENCGFINFKK